MPNDPILDAISGVSSGSVAVADDPILDAISGTSRVAPKLVGQAQPTGKIATPDMVGQWAHDNDATIAEAHHHFQSLGYVLGDYEDAGVPRPQVAPTIAREGTPQPRIINLDLGRIAAIQNGGAPQVKPNALLNAPPFEPPTMTEMIGNAIPDAAVPVLAGAKKYLVDPFERMAAKGAEFGRDVAQSPIEELTGLQHLPEMVEQAKYAKYGPIPAGETLEEQASREHPIAMGVTGAVGSTVGGVAADPRNWPFLASSAARPLLQKLVSGGFGMMMSKDAIQRAQQLSQQWDTLSPEQRTEQITGLGINTLFAGASAAHALSKTPTVGAGEQLHPETPETLQAQVDALENGTNKAVYFPKGQQNIPAAPDGATVTAVKGNKPGAGTWYHDKSITPDEIHDAVADGTYHQLLGITQSKEEAVANGQPATVVARDENGTELKAALADGSSPQAIAEQAAELGRQFPNAKVGVETPESVISKRQAPTTQPETPEAGAPLSEQTQPVERRVTQGLSPTGVERRTQAQQDYQAAIESTPPGQPTPGEKLSQEIRAARAGAPAGITEGEALQRIMSDPQQYEEYRAADQKGRDRMLVQAKNEMAGSLNVRSAADTQDLAQRVTSIEQRQAAGEKIPLAEIHELHGLMDRIQAGAEPLDAIHRAIRGEGVEPVDNILEAINGRSSSKPLESTTEGGHGEVPQEEMSLAGHGPGTPLKGVFDRTGTRIDELAQVIRENSSATKPIKARIDLGAKVAAKIAGAKDTFTRGLATVKGAAGAMFDALRRPEPWTDFEDALGKYQGAVQRSALEIRRLAKSLTKAVPDKVRREGMANFMEAGGDAATLRKWADASKGARKAGYEAGLNLTNAEKTIARNMMAAQDERFQLDKEAGLVEHQVENYVQHIWGRESKYTKRVVNNVRAMTLETKPSFTKQRVFGTYFKGEQAGYKPVDKDAGFLFAAREHSANQAIAARGFIRSLLDGKAEDGRPLVAVSGSGRAIKEGDEGPKAYLIDARTKPEEVADYRSVDHPALRNWKWIGADENGKPSFVRGDIVVHPDAYGKLKNVLGKSALRSYTIPGTEIQPGRVALKLGSEFKNTLLSFSAFHQTQEGLHALFHQVNPFTTKALDFSDPVQSKLVDHGLQVASFDAQEQFSEGLSGAGLTQKLPIIGKYFQRYNEYLFGDLIPRLKMTLAKEALERNLTRYKGKLTNDQVYALTANQANAAFGELNYTMMARNKTFQDVLRMSLLAPDFLEARGRFVGQAVKPYGREQAFALMRGALGLYVGARLLNMAFNNGDPKWDPEAAFSLAYKGRMFTLRSVPGDIAHLFSDPRGFVYNRLNPLYGRGTIEGITGRDQYGRKQSAIEQAKDLATGAAPIPFQGFVSKKGGETGPLNTVLSSAGVATSKYRTPAERLARELMFDRMPANPGQQSAKQKLMRDLEDGIRQGKFPTQEIGKHLNNGELSADDAVKVLENSQAPELARNFKRLGLEDALQVWDKASPAERKQLRPVLQDKAERAVLQQSSDSPRYSSDEWNAVAAKIRVADPWEQARKTPKKSATSGWSGKIPWLPSNAGTSVVPMQPPQ